MPANLLIYFTAIVSAAVLASDELEIYNPRRFSIKHLLDILNSNGNNKRLSDIYADNSPIPHIIFDNFFDAGLLNAG